MGYLSLFQTIRGADAPWLGPTSLIDVTGGPTPDLVITAPGIRRQVTMSLSDTIDPASVDYGPILPNWGRETITVNGHAGRISLQTIERLSGPDDSGRTYLDGVGFGGNLCVLHRAAVGDADILVAAPVHGAGLSTFFLDADHRPVAADTLAPVGSGLFDAITAMDSVTLGGRTLLVVASGTVDALSVLELGADGGLRSVSAFGPGDVLPVDRLSALEIVTVGTKTFVLAGAFGTGSITVLDLAADGQLSFVDQVNDTRDTRFGGLSALDVVSLPGTDGAHVFVAASGNDGGLSLFQLLPDGKLIHRETMVHDTGTELDGVTALRFAGDGPHPEIIAIDSRDPGLSRIRLDPGELGRSGTFTTGSDARDVLIASGTGAALSAAGGDDVLVDGDGADTLTGGGGADLFVLSRDGMTDTVTDFDPAADRIDLSVFDFLGGMHEISVTRNAGRDLILRWSDETLILQGADGRDLSAADVESALIFDTGRVIQHERLPMLGAPGNDVFVWAQGPDTIDGGSGYDRIDYADSPTGVIVDLTDPTRNAGGAESDWLSDIEAVSGSRLNDRITGDEAANTLWGIDGDDFLDGGAGADWLLPGLGQDTVEGGAGTDMVSYLDLARNVSVDLGAGRATKGAVVDTIGGIENVTGSIYADVLRGDAGANRLRGMGDYDWIIGSAGADTIEGGNGRDMISYVYSDVAVTVNLASGRGMAGQALGDVYDSIERVTGSIYADLIYGGAADEDIRGLGSYDWFIGSPGKDRFDGGSGYDTVAYWHSATGAVANLNLGRGTAGDAARDLYTSIENLTGSSHADHLTGDNGRNILRGLYGQDTLLGAGGVDRLEGGASDDLLDGGWGWDVAIFSGARAEYAITRIDEDRMAVEHRNGGYDGTDTLIAIEALQFSDGMAYF